MIFQVGWIANDFHDRVVFTGTGSAMVKVVPVPGPWLSAVIWPPCASTRALAMARPIPDPPWSRSRAVSTR